MLCIQCNVWVSDIALVSESNTGDIVTAKLGGPPSDDACPLVVQGAMRCRNTANMECAALKKCSLQGGCNSMQESVARVRVDTSTTGRVLTSITEPGCSHIFHFRVSPEHCSTCDVMVLALRPAPATSSSCLDRNEATVLMMAL